jgi:hypothetical protein
VRDGVPEAAPEGRSPRGTADERHVVLREFWARGYRVGMVGLNEEQILQYQQVWVLEGTIEITHGRNRHLLGKGDCLAMEWTGRPCFTTPRAEPNPVRGRNFTGECHCA